MDSRTGKVKERTRKKFIIRCKHENCIWTSPEIYAYSQNEANDIACQIHDTSNDHHLRCRSGRKNYCVKCICGQEIIFKANGKRKEAIKIATEIHDLANDDHEFRLDKITELK